MSLVQLALLGAAGYVGYRYFRKTREGSPAAFAANQPSGSSHFAPVRDAGPEAMRDTPRRRWSAVDEASDESFPASDPPATY